MKNVMALHWKRFFFYAVILFVTQLIFTNETFAQTQTIGGKVTDASTNESLPGVTILVKGSTRGVTTDLDGKFSLEAKVGEILTFSYIGYVPEEVVLSGQVIVNISLKPDVQKLDEVVVVGYGSVKRSDLTGAAGSVKSEELIKRGATGVLESMQGAIAGVNITKTSSRPGAGFDIQIRGLNSFNSGVSALYVVDGIVTNDINFLNPSDIVKIDVLKDASSTAIYGSRGSNGVVLVTTKTGQNSGAKNKTIVSYSGFYGIKTPARLPKQYSSRDWFDYRSHAYLQYAPGAGDNGMADWKITLSGVYMAMPEAARRAYERDETDWLGALTQNGKQQNHYLNISGNAEKYDFNIGIGYQDEDGIYMKENLKRYNLKLSLNYKISDKWMTGATANLSQTEIEYGNSAAYTETFRMSPIFKIYDAAGNVLIQPGLASNMGG
jgi:TonB-linked SusC/RagA family outer membrane protein